MKTSLKSMTIMYYTVKHRQESKLGLILMKGKD